MLAQILALVVALACVNGSASAQFAVRLGGGAFGGSGGPTTGVGVEMFESANLDRFLRKAQEFLGRRDYDNAIKVLQNIVEGRTVEFLVEEEKTKPKDPKNPKDPKTTPANQQPSGWPLDEDDPEHAVFSVDDRLYRPVARLCHELLASLPPAGIGLYKARYGYPAEEAYREALSALDLPGLNGVFKRYFVTKHAGLAMLGAADLQMDRGRFRAAIQTYRLLLDLYPEGERRELGRNDLDVWLKLAICYQQLGETGAARDVLVELVKRWPRASVRVMGELYPVKGLAESELFGSQQVEIEGADPAHSTSLGLSNDFELVPLWEFRFTDPNPYRKAKTGKNVNRPYVQAQGPTGFPKLDITKPGTTAWFVGDNLVFKDHYRLVSHDLRTGLQLLSTTSVDEALDDKNPETVPKAPKPYVPRPRLPVYDYFAQRVSHDAERFYVAEGYRGTPNIQSMKAVTVSNLRCFDRKTGRELWVTKNRKYKDDNDKEVSFKDVSFLAAPTVFRSTLLVPFMNRGSYGLISLDGKTGRQVFRVYLHAGGSSLARAPSAPVKTAGGVAYVLTNAGVLSAVDANTGSLLWSRKYERIHPLRGKKKFKRPSARRNIGFGRMNRQISEERLTGFLPSDLILVEGRVIFAPTDSKVLMCVNGASGKPLWMLSQSPSGSEPSFKKMESVVGWDRRNIYLMCDGSTLLCVDLRSGVRKWVVALPPSAVGNADWLGRGVVTEDHVIMPGASASRAIYVLNTKEEDRSWRRVPLPSLGVSKERLQGASNLAMRGPYLAISYEGGVELFSSVAAMESLAKKEQDPRRKASFLLRSGKPDEAIHAILGALDGELEASERQKLVLYALELTTNKALAAAGKEKRNEAIATMDTMKSVVEAHGSDKVKRRWHLARLDVFRALRDAEGMEKEQDIIESWFER